jgi:hypothetical protein
MDHKVSEDGDILIVKWFDNKDVLVGSNSYSINPTSQVKWWDKSKKEYMFIPIPALIRAYNKGMGGGVNRSDQRLFFSGSRPRSGSGTGEFCTTSLTFVWSMPTFCTRRKRKFLFATSSWMSSSP